jgi:DNA polymerase IV
MDTAELPSRFPPPRRVLHVDVDAMFVQCAVMADPQRLARERFILVGGRPDRRGVVASASYGCRDFGVRSAMPMSTALRLCPQALVVGVPGEVVRQKSRELSEVLRDWAPIVSMASVDEAYLDLSGTEALYRHEPFVDTARRIQRAVKERAGLDVSLGGATNRLVAKLATSLAKPAGVYIVDVGTEAEFVAGLEIEDLIGVGPALQEELRRRGISTMRRLRSVTQSTLASWLGDDRAAWLWRRCRGIDSTPIAVEEGIKSVSSETTFPVDLHTTAELEHALLTQVVEAAGSLRRKRLYARTITVKLRDTDFRDRSRSRTLDEGLQTEAPIFRVARELLAHLRAQRHTSARLIGVSLANLTPAGETTQAVLAELAPPAERERDRALARAADRLKAKYGQNAVQPARLVSPRDDPTRK